GPVVSPSELNADIQVSYVSGGPAAGLPIALSAVIRDSYPRYRDYDSYSFDPPTAEGISGGDSEEPDQRLFLDKRAVALDEQGGARLRVDAIPSVSRPSELRFEA